MEEVIKNIKKEFMTYRNGIVADSLRKAGMTYDIIFGLQLPQIKSIGSLLKENLNEDQLRELSRILWNDRKVRESRILALAILSPSSISEENAKEMAQEILTREEADLFPFLLLRHTPYLQSVKSGLDIEKPIQKYLAAAISRFII